MRYSLSKNCYTECSVHFLNISLEEHLWTTPGHKCFGCGQTLGMNTLVGGTDFRQRRPFVSDRIEAGGGRGGREKRDWNGSKGQQMLLLGEEEAND